MFAPSVAPDARRRPPAPREEIDGKGGGEKAIKTGRGEGEEREKRITSEGRKRKALKRGNQPNPHSTRKWQQAAAAAAAAPHYFLHRLRGYRRHGHRLLQAPSPCIVANEGHATGSLPFIGCCCRLPHLPPTKVVPRPPLVGRSDGLGTKSRKENDRASFKRFLPSA